MRSRLVTGDPVVVLFFKTAEDFFCLLFPTGSPRALPFAEYMLLRRAGDTVVALSHLFLQQLPLLLRAQKKRAGDFDLYRSIGNRKQWKQWKQSKIRSRSQIVDRYIFGFQAPWDPLRVISLTMGDTHVSVQLLQWRGVSRSDLCPC